jgi:hypothetical protein
MCDGLLGAEGMCDGLLGAEGAVGSVMVCLVVRVVACVMVCLVLLITACAALLRPSQHSSLARFCLAPPLSTQLPINTALWLASALLRPSLRSFLCLAPPLSAQLPINTALWLASALLHPSRHSFPSTQLSGSLLPCSAPLSAASHQLSSEWAVECAVVLAAEWAVELLLSALLYLLMIGEWCWSV